jgi:aminopeptidase N
MDTVIPIHYEIFIESNFEAFSFEGKTKISLLAKNTASEIVLNAMDLTFTSCKLIKNNEISEVEHSLDYNAEELHLKLKSPISGNFEIHFEYTGKIKDNLKGLYKTQYKVGDEIHTGAITQFQTEDARRMFPCFDEPNIKATFSLEVNVDEKFSTISNTPILTEIKHKNGRKSIKFETTPKMSTYLLFLGIAEFESIKSKLGKIDVKVITHPGLSQFGHQALDFGLKSLDYCQKYYNIPYPLPKLDLICTPDFAEGAMENWGAILFRESALLKFPGFSSMMQEVMSRGTIAHEITHQWFGNLVSPASWKYVWLNESFATFFGFKIVDHYFPQFRVWDRVIGFATSMGLISDGYHETVPIEMKEQKKTSYNIKSVPIIYMKGGAMLRMIENFVGDETFQKGLQIFLKKHAYDVASSDDLWTALEQASNGEKPVTRLMRSWVLQPGYPMISVSREGNKLKFSQERFTYLDFKYDTLWLVPISILIINEQNEQSVEQYLLEGKEGHFDIGFNFKAFKLNVDHNGFFRVKYKVGDIKNLGELISENRLTPLDSWNLENDIFAQLKAGKISLDYYLNFIPFYKSEKLQTSITAISNQLTQIHSLSEGENKSKIAEIGIKFHENILGKIEYGPIKNEIFTNTIMRNGLLTNAGKLGSPKAIDYCLSEFQKLKKGQEVSADLRDAILSVSARQTNDLDWFLNKFDSATNEIEIITLGNVFGEFSSEKVIDKVIEELVFTKVPQRNQAGVINRLCDNPFAIKKMWKFFIANLDNIGKMHESIQMRTIDAIVQNSVDNEIKKDMEEFFKDFTKNNPAAKITLEKSFESLEINLQLKKHINKVY